MARTSEKLLRELVETYNSLTGKNYDVRSRDARVGGYAVIQPGHGGTYHDVMGGSPGNLYDTLAFAISEKEMEAQAEKEKKNYLWLHSYLRRHHWDPGQGAVVGDEEWERAKSVADDLKYSPLYGDIVRKLMRMKERE